MKNSKVLEMLHQNRIEELKAALQDEIFTESLKTKPNAKKRYAAMKKYLTTVSSAREILQKPCEVEYEGDKYNAFTNSYSLVLTNEPCGEIPMCDEPDRYPQVTRLIKFEGLARGIDINKALAEIKSKGYKFKKNELMSNEYLLHYDGSYFRAALIDITYNVINDGEKVVACHKPGPANSLMLQNDIGMALILPIRMDGKPEEWITVVDID